jgi:hypothetical protein
VLRAIAEAHHNIEKVTLERAEGICRGIGINRRKIVNGKAEFSPNHDGVNDERLTVVRCVTADGKNKGILVHFTCHPTTTDANEVTSEFCGVATEILDGIWGDGVSCFLQGCCADIRPSLYQDDRFYKGDQRDVERLGAILADGVSNLLSAPMTKLEPAPLQGWIQHVTLPFERIPTVADIAEEPGDSEVIAEWKRMMRDHLPETEAALQIQLVQLARGLSLVAMNGEMVVEYGLAIREATEHQALPIGYSNGMIGYVSTARQIDEGGYESVTSGYVFGLPSPFTSDVERRVRQGIHEVVEKIVY